MRRSIINQMMERLIVVVNLTLSFTLKSIQQMMGRKPRSRLRPTHYGAVLLVVNLMNAIGFFALLLGQKHAMVPGYWHVFCHLLI